jgi:hypothetical protein
VRRSLISQHKLDATTVDTGAFGNRTAELLKTASALEHVYGEWGLHRWTPRALVSFENETALAYQSAWRCPKPWNWWHYSPRSTISSYFITHSITSNAFCVRVCVCVCVCVRAQVRQQQKRMCRINETMLKSIRRRLILTLNEKHNVNYTQQTATTKWQRAAKAYKHTQHTGSKKFQSRDSRGSKPAGLL